MRERLLELAAERPRFGYRRLHVLLVREGWAVNHKRIRRMYRKESLGCAAQEAQTDRSDGSSAEGLARGAQRALVDGLHGRQPGYGPRASGRFNVVDDFTRECVAIEVDTSLSGERVTRVLDQVIERRGRPRAW